MTGLTYMQQRYYDPMIGRFLSVDPVTAYRKPITNFNRYGYALENPYRFMDPDGRYQCDIKMVCPKITPIIEQIQKARDFYKKQSSEYRRLNAILKHLGTENDGKGPNIINGKLNAPNAAKADQKGTIIIDFDQVEKKGDKGIYEGGRSLTHETQHDIDAGKKGPATEEGVVRDRETKGYRTENVYMKAFGLEMTPKDMEDGIEGSVQLWKNGP